MWKWTACLPHQFCTDQGLSARKTKPSPAHIIHMMIKKIHAIGQLRAPLRSLQISSNIGRVFRRARSSPRPARWGTAAAGRASRKAARGDA